MDFLDDMKNRPPSDGPDCATCDAWHSNRKVPLALIFAILIQSFSGIWWAAKIDERVENLNAQVVSTTADRFYKSEALQYFALRDVEIANNRKQIEALRDDINKALDKFDHRFDKIGTALERISADLNRNTRSK